MNPHFRQAVEAFQNGDLERALRLAQSEVSNSSSSQAHHLLGLVHCRLGDPAAGLEHLRFAADAEPENAAFQIMLMRALIDSGQPGEVLGMPEPPRIRRAAELELWRARGEAAIAADDFGKSAQAWRKIVDAAPDDWRAWANLGSALASQNQLSDAIEAFAKAAQLNTSEQSIRWSLASALAAGDRNEEALATLEALEQVSGPTAESALARGRSLIALARFDEAEKAYREMLELSPANADAFGELGLLFERTNRLESLAQLLADAAAAGIPADRLAYLHALHAFRDGRAEEAYALLETADPDEDPVRWYRLKSKIADRLNKPAESFAAAEAMNRFTSEFDMWRERGADYRSRLRALAKILSRQQLPQLSQANRRAPAFLVGFPRSGTTLLDTFLMGHRDTFVLEEEHLLGAAERQIGRVADLPQASGAVLERARTAYFAELDRHVEPGFCGLVIDKLPLNLLGAPFIESLFPGAPIIFAQRHPCDAVLSGFMQSFVMNDAMASFLTIEDAADLYDSVMSGWKELRDAFSLNVHTVRYESLVVDPEGELRPLVHFLGLPWDEEMLAHTKTAKTRGAIITPSYDQVTEPLTSRSVDRWKKYRRQLEPVLPVLLRWAEYLGYVD